MKLVRTNDVPWAQAMEHGKFSGRRKELAGEKLRCGLWELPPGKRSFPLHLHHVTEEALFVVSGHATVHTPEGDTEIGPGDYVSFPPGGPAHQLVNLTDTPMVYLGLAATFGVDVVEYPDSDKLACSVGSGPNSKRFVFRKKDPPDYFEGED